MKIGFLLLLCFWIGSAGSTSIVVKGQLQSSPMQLNLSLKGAKPKVKTFALHQPERVVIDISDTRLQMQWNRLSLPSSVIKKIRSATQANGTLRIVLDITRPIQPRIQALTSISKAMHTLSIALPSSAWGVKGASKSRAVAQKKSTSPLSPVPKRMRDVIVAIDPGHGGKDPGASGPKKTLEKNIVLSIARRLKAIIDAQPGMKAVLTRNGDYYIGLRQRLQIARKNDADIFVAIHADAFKNRNSNGASVFALSQNGATSEAARWIAEKENYSELGGVNLTELDDHNGVVRSVLIDLSQTATIGASVHMGERILQSLGKMTRLHNTKVEQARFVVLKSPDTPSVLVETGFISNPKEERNLRSTRYQQRLAQAIFSGIKGYFWEFPPYGSRIEILSSARNHVVVAGETLSGIAQRYRISVKTLQNSNQLPSTGLRIGQKLVIPSAWG